MRMIAFPHCLVSLSCIRPYPPEPAVQPAFAGERPSGSEHEPNLNGISNTEIACADPSEIRLSGLLLTEDHRRRRHGRNDIKLSWNTDWIRNDSASYAYSASRSRKRKPVKIARTIRRNHLRLGIFIDHDAEPRKHHFLARQVSPGHC